MSSPTAAISFSFEPYPAIRRFMDEDATVVPDAVKLRVLRALTVGGLHPSQFEQATKSWRACNEQRCVGMVGSAVDGTLAIEAVLDGSVWHVSVDDGTRILPPGSDIEPGAFVEAFTSDGATADFVISFDMPLP